MGGFFYGHTITQLNRPIPHRFWCNGGACPEYVCRALLGVPFAKNAWGKTQKNRLWPRGTIRMGIVYRMVHVPRHAPCPPTSMINARRTMVYNGPYPPEWGQNPAYSGSLYAAPLPRRKCACGVHDVLFAKRQAAVLALIAGTTSFVRKVLHFGPCHMRLWVHRQRLFFFIGRGPCAQQRPIGHDKGNVMVCRMNVFFHV